MDQNNTTKKQQLIGIVVSDKMMKTVVVKVDMKKRHPKYHKAYSVSRKFKAHDENSEFHVGDRVVIESIRPKSREKKFKVISRITRGSTTATADQNADQREDQRKGSA